MGICDSVVVITKCCIASGISYCIDLLDTVSVQCIFVINNCVETDNVSLFQSGGITFLNEDQVSGAECR